MEASYVNRPSDIAVYPEIKWIKWNEIESLVNAVPGGRLSSGEILYVGRGKVSCIHNSVARIAFERYAVGYIIPSLSRLCAVFRLRTYVLADFEVLSINPSSYEWTSKKTTPLHAVIGHMEYLNVRYIGRTMNVCGDESLVGTISPSANQLSYFNRNALSITYDFEYLVLKPSAKPLLELCIRKIRSVVELYRSMTKENNFFNTLLRYKTVLHPGNELRAGTMLTSENGLHSIEVDSSNHLVSKSYAGSFITAVNISPIKVSYFRLLLDGLHIGCLNDNQVTAFERVYPYVLTANNNDILISTIRIDDRNGYLRLNFITKTKRELIYVLDALDDLLE